MSAILKAKRLNVSIAKETFYVGVFTGLAIYTPYVVHFFGGVDAGQKFLPMPFFVLLAGILLGWRAGLATAIAAPLISFSLSGMPAMKILPYLMFQLAVFGLVSGIIRKKMDVFFSLLVAMISGWIAIGVSLALFSKMNALNYVFTGIKNGLPGIAISLIIIPFAAYLINKYFSDEKGV